MQHVPYLASDFRMEKGNQLAYAREHVRKLRKCCAMLWLRRSNIVRLAFLFTLLTSLLRSLPELRVAYRAKCGVYTPYHLTPGGGEKVILNMVLALQRLTGGRVDIIVDSKNTCTHLSCVKQLSRSLQISGINWRRVQVKKRRKYKKGNYLVWISMGNTLFPAVQSQGLFSIYHCQFPFDFHDFHKPVESLDEHYLWLSSYDLVYLNSKYTAKWYLKAFEVETVSYASRMGGLPKLPAVTNFPPPLTKRFTVDEHLNRDGYKGRTITIVLIGRFFEGTQSKHHMDAIEAFKQLKRLCACSPEMFLVGHVAHGHEGYVRKLREAANAEKGVSLVTNAASSQIDSILRRATIIWSLTGFGSPEVMNPADAEHFGIALVEGMAVGLVPIVGGKGGPVEIVESLPLRLSVTTIDELAMRTYEVIRLSDSEYLRLRSAVIARAAELDTFHESFDSIFNFLGLQLRPENALFWKHIVQRVSHATKRFGGLSSSRRQSSGHTNQENAVVYVETRHDLALRGNVLNLYSALGAGWVFHIWYGEGNEMQLRTSLDGLDFVNFHALASLELEGGLDPRERGAYQTLFKSRRFWEVNGPAEHVLTFQSDTWFHNKGFDHEWLKNDYIGAPWCLQGNSVYLPPTERPAYDFKMLHTTRQLDVNTRVGNGGLSIRNNRAMIDIIKSYANESDSQENEDVFTVSSLQRAGYQVASKDVASYFSLECICPDIRLHQMIMDEWTRMTRMSLAAVRNEGEKRFTFAVHKPALVFGHLARVSGINLKSIKLFVEIFL